MPINNVLWSNETKISSFGSDATTYVRRPAKKEYDPKYTKYKIFLNDFDLLIQEKIRASDFFRNPQKLNAFICGGGLMLDNDPKHSS